MAKKAAVAKKTGKRGRPPGSGKKKVKEATPAKVRKERMAAHQINKEDQTLFLSHLDLIAVCRGRITKATNDIRRLYKTAKADGFIKADFDTAFALQSEGGEKARKLKIARELLVAKYLGVELGKNYDLFADQGVEEQPPEKRAFDAGKQDAFENKKADATGYDEQEYLKGYHSVSEKRVKDGIKAKEPAKEPESKYRKRNPDPATVKAADRAEKSAQARKNAAQRAADGDAFQEGVIWGTPITRSRVNAMRAAQAAKDEKAAAGPDPEHEQASMFQRHEAAV